MGCSNAAVASPVDMTVSQQRTIAEDTACTSSFSAWSPIAA